MFGPGIDLTFIAGGLTFALLPLCLLTSGSLTEQSFLLLLFFCNYPHYMATNYRIYSSRSQIERYRLFAVHFTGLMLLAAVLGHVLRGPWIKVLYTVYFTWSPFHYSGQNYGISLMYLRRGGVDPTPTDRWLLYVSFIAAFLMDVVYMNVASPGDTPLVQLGIPPDVAHGLYLVLLGVGAVAALGFLWRIVGRAPLRVLTPALLLMATQFTWFAVATGVPLFSADLAQHGVRLDNLLPPIAFLHCAQYLGVTAYYAKRERSEHGSFDFWSYFRVLIVGGVFLWLGTTRLLSEVFGVDYALSYVIVLSLINIHHFVMDGAIWKLRDGRIARLLVGAPTTPAVPAPAVVEPSFGRGGRRLLWAGAAVVALWLGATDVLYRIGIRRAQELAQAGNRREARDLYQRVARMNPRTAEAIDGLAYGDLTAGDVERAVERWRESIALNPTSAYAYVGIGEAYLKLGRVDDAITSLERATALAPGQPSGFSLLAQAYAAKGEAEKAEMMRGRAEAITAAARAPRPVY
jgi:tetratricopeptide (TPR) repeat protein